MTDPLDGEIVVEEDVPPAAITTTLIDTDNEATLASLQSLLTFFVAPSATDSINIPPSVIAFLSPLSGQLATKLTGGPMAI